MSGWARDPETPASPVSLVITVNDELRARVLADRQREDLRAAGAGHGRHGFEVALRGLSPGAPYTIAVRRERDGAHLHGSPVVIAPAKRFDMGVQAECAEFLADVADDDDLTGRLRFLADQVETLLQLRAVRRGRSAERIAQRQIRWRLAAARPGGAAATGADVLRPRALVIDEVAPNPSRDAGSEAILSHMRSLRRLGFEVVFAPADMRPDHSGALDAAGIACCHAPWDGSVEEVLRREAGCFDLVYLHRAPIASRYIGLVRARQPKARLVYSVADLQHLRLARQAQVEDRPELLALARQLQTVELQMAAAAHAVITHSRHEADLLRQFAPGVPVHVVSWSIEPRPTTARFADRNGLAFIGCFDHPPDLDAAYTLISDIMPRVRTVHPSITCLLAGSHLPDAFRRPTPGIEVLGQVDDVSGIFDRIRLTVAPMAYGAGVKSEVLQSLAAGIPCVCSPLAAEGLDWPPALRALIAADAAGFAALIGRLHEDATFNARCREAAYRYAAQALSQARIDALMRDVAALPAVRYSGFVSQP